MTRLVLVEGGSAVSFPPGVVESLQAAGTVIFPTDTLYGLGVDPRSETGLRKLFSIKGREGRKPIPLLLDGPGSVSLWAEHVSPAAARLMERFWPGALTIVLPAWPEVPDLVTAGSGAVGLRVPDHPVPRALARALGGAITGTSANRAGNPGTWDSAEEIVREFTGEADWVLWDGSRSGTGRTASTVVRAGEHDVSLLREGSIPIREITDFLRKG